MENSHYTIGTNSSMTKTVLYNFNGDYSGVQILMARQCLCVHRYMDICTELFEETRRPQG